MATLRLDPIQALQLKDLQLLQAKLIQTTNVSVTSPIINLLQNVWIQKTDLKWCH